jgi:hypothetical protein
MSRLTLGEAFDMKSKLLVLGIVTFFGLCLYLIFSGGWKPPRARASSDAQNERAAIIFQWQVDGIIQESPNDGKIFVMPTFHRLVFKDKRICMFVCCKYHFEIPDGITTGETLYIHDALSGKQVGWVNDESGLHLD